MMNRLEKLKEMLIESPADAFLLFALAKEYESAGAQAEALEGYRKLQALHPDYVGLYYHLGKLLEQEGQGKAALEVYHQGLEVAKRVGDGHAFRELSSVALNLQIELDE